MRTYIMKHTRKRVLELISKPSLRSLRLIKRCDFVAFFKSAHKAANRF